MQEIYTTSNRDNLNLSHALRHASRTDDNIPRLTSTITIKATQGIDNDEVHILSCTHIYQVNALAQSRRKKCIKCGHIKKDI